MVTASTSRPITRSTRRCRPPSRKEAGLTNVALKDLMADPVARLSRWNETDLLALLTLEELGADRFRTRFGDSNRNGRSYGGQGMGQAMTAASMTVSPDRFATMMQFLFLQGTVPGEPIDLDVTHLQDGKRFSSRRVRGTQSDGRIVFEALFSFAIPSSAPEHATPTAALESRPEDLPSLLDLSAFARIGLGHLGSYSPHEKACIDFRIPEIDRQLSPDLSETRFRFWLKARETLPANPRVHVAAFAYLSDWWLNFSSLGAHITDLDDSRPLYISSLNHCVWFHRPFAADQWLHFGSESPCAAEGRGLSMARIHDLDGRLVASATQECLMAFARNP